jgi:hypothetical protein
LSAVEQVAVHTAAVVEQVVFLHQLLLDFLVVLLIQ